MTNTKPLTPTDAELDELRQANSGAADLRDTLINIAREIEALKRECGMNPEPPIAIQNGRYMALSYKVRALAAGQATAAQQGAVYAALPEPDCVMEDWRIGGVLVDYFTTDQMRAYVDADRAMRAAQPAPENIRSILARCRDFIDTAKAPAYPAGADLADEIDALLAAQPAPQQKVQEPVAWMTQEGDRVVTEKTMNAARRGGGAMLTSLHSYSVALVRAAAPQPSPASQGDALDAARLDWLLLHISGAEFRRIGVHYSGNARRADVDAARKQGANHD